MTMTVTSSTAPKSSWAQIAKGKATDTNANGAQTRLKPGARGSLMCLCRGKVLAMLSHYGWLMVYGEVDHESSEKHEGHIYFSKKDIEDGEALLPGDIVNFHLYVDEKGLGAERCTLEERAPSNFNANADEFVPMVEKSGHNMRADADVFVPTLEKCNMRADADEFVPMVEKSVGQHLSADANGFLPSTSWSEPSSVTNVFARLSAVFASDDEEDDDDFLSSPGIPSDVDRESLSDESGDSSEDDQIIKWQAQVESPLLKPRPKVKRPASPDGSTSAGTSSDSDGESSCDAFPTLTGKSPWACSTKPGFRPPPGLTPMPHYRPPPGLSFPWEVDDC